MKDLLDGHTRFRTGYWRRHKKRFFELAKQGQQPQAMVIACSDSRVSPEQIFDVSPGEIFVVRNVANLVPPYETTPGRHGVSAALEFAVTVLEVSDVIVMGHGACGGVKASLTRLFENARRGEGGFVADWVELLDEARDEVEAMNLPEAEAIRALEFGGVKASLKNLRSFPFVRERETAGTLRLHGGLFAIADGELLLLDEAKGSFAPITA